MIVLGFLAAAVAGTLGRWRFAERLPRPVGTLAVNLIGSFLLGLVAGSGSDSQLVLGVAGLGSFTTFSTVMVEVLDLWTTDRRRAAIYLIATMAGAVAFAWVGLRVA
jgi:fluoride exporter